MYDYQCLQRKLELEVTVSPGFKELILSKYYISMGGGGWQNVLVLVSISNCLLY